MFHRKPLYVAIAQRKEERQAQLQLQYAQRMAGLAGPSTAVIPGGYPPIYYQAPSGVVPQVPPRPGLMYQPLGLRPGWRANGFAPTSGPAYQPPPVSVVSTILLISSYFRSSAYHILLQSVFFFTHSCTLMLLKISSTDAKTT